MLATEEPDCAVTTENQKGTKEMRRAWMRVKVMPARPNSMRCSTAQQLSDISGAVENEQSAVAAQEQRLKSIRGHLDSLTKSHKEVQKNLSLLQELEVQTQKVKAAKTALKETNVNVEQQDEELRVLSNRSNVRLPYVSLC